ncbi:MAG: carboxypeptidase regulatory-like protein [Flaviaesturariibacter sp.]|nr:carboxypeptidase regulatory-like protein [Flaviaesturariibacter sp.]
MFLAVQRLCLESDAIVSLNPAFHRSVAALAALNSATSAAQRGQAVNVAGEYSVKDRAKNTLTHLLSKVSDLLAAYAVEKNDDRLAQRAVYTTSGLARLQDNALNEIADIVIAEADKAARSDGGDFGITPVLVTSLTAAAGAFRETKDAPRVATTERSTKTRTLAEHITATSRHIRRKMDKLVTFYKETHPEFHKQYFESRKVMDLAGGAKAEKPDVIKS